MGSCKAISSILILSLFVLEGTFAVNDTRQGSGEQPDETTTFSPERQTGEDAISPPNGLSAGGIVAIVVIVLLVVVVAGFLGLKYVQRRNKQQSYQQPDEFGNPISFPSVSFQNDERDNNM